MSKRTVAGRSKPPGKAGAAAERPGQIMSKFRGADRPQVALITNHGYGGIAIPIGGAPDTGGQNQYVNSMALALDELGYRVTIFARGGFPQYDAPVMRSESESLSENVMYVYVPGGGASFLRKEDIAIALDEELDWLDDYIRREANQQGCQPWELYQFVNTHYWDAAVLGVGLVERWRNDVVAESLCQALLGILPPEATDQLRSQRHWQALADTPHYHLGRLLMRGEPTEPLEQRGRRGAEAWCQQRELPADQVDLLAERVSKAVKRAGEAYPLAMHPMFAYEELGRAALEQAPEMLAQMEELLTRTERHVWTPHSLGDLKDWNFRNRPLDVRRALKFNERRSHERMACDRTGIFAATSSDIAEYLHTHYRVPIEQIFYFPPCIETDRYRRYNKNETAATYQYLAELSGLSVDQLRKGRILFETSRMDDTKRKDLVLSGFARVAEAFPDTYLFIGGGPVNDHFRTLERQIERREILQGRAWLTGPLPDEHMGPLFSMADVYVTASEMEGFGMSVAQAAAAETIVVSSDCVPFTVHHAPDACLLFRTGDLLDLANAMSQALADDQQQRAKAKELAKRVHTLNWKDKSRDFIAFLRRQAMDVAHAGTTS